MDKFKEIRNSRIDLKADLKPQPIVLSYGVDWNGEPLCVMGEGDYSVISGLSKSKKSFFKSMVVSSYISEKEPTDMTPLRSHRDGDKIVLDIDTEQSDFHAQRTFRRTRLMTGVDYPYHYCYSLRGYEPKERLNLLETMIEQYKDRIGLICLDGYIDFVERFNDEDESRQFLQKILKWTDDYQFHITGVLHKNPDGGKMIGHIGSLVERKASTIISLSKVQDKKDQSLVVHERGRDMEFDDFLIEINQGLPYKL